MGTSLVDSEGNVKGYPDNPTSQIYGPDGSAGRGAYADITLPPIYGIEFDQNNDTWTHIDASGNSISLNDTDFSSHPIWGGIQRVNLNADGSIAAEWGDSGYAHDGTNGRVMVQIPKFWYKYTNPSSNVYRFWVASYAADGFTLHPTFDQGSVSEYAYLGAYEADAFDDSGTMKLHSRSGVQPSTDADTSSSYTITTARSYAQNVGTGWQQQLVWGYGAHKLLSMIYLGSMDFQSQIGRGIVDKASGTGFAGEITGYDSIDTQLSQANLGTATGTGTDGLTPVSVLWLENPYGNIWTFVDGYEATDAEYRILNRDGSWSVVGPGSWTSSDYEASTASPLADDDGYINNIEAEELLAILGIPSSTAGSSSTYIPDNFWSHDSGENNILRSGARWSDGGDAGLGALYSPDGVTHSARGFGARLSYIG